MPGAANRISYEPELNRFTPRHPLIMLCLYDLDWFRGDLFLDILTVHPKVLVNSAVLGNHYYIVWG